LNIYREKQEIWRKDSGSKGRWWWWWSCVHWGYSETQTRCV